MGAANQTEVILLRLYSIDPGANGVYTVGTAATGWLDYKEGGTNLAVNLVLNRTGVGVYSITLPRAYSRQEVSINAWTDTQASGVVQFGAIAWALTGGTLPVFNVITVSTFSDAGVTAANRSFSLRMVRTRLATTAG